MKSSKSNTIIPVATKNFSLRHLRYDLSATLHSSSEQPFDFTMHYNGHRESTYVLDNRSNTLPTTYPELAKYQGSSCRLLRHSNNPLRFTHWMGTPRNRGFSDRPELRALKVSWISYILHPAKSRTFPVQNSILKKLLIVFVACLPHGWHGRDHFPGHRMSGIGRSYSIWNHPFIIIFECIITTLYSSNCSPHDCIL